MKAHFSRVDSLNVHAERSRLTPEMLARWRGLPVGWFDASAVSRNRNFLVPRPLLALLDSGVAQARFDFGVGEQTFDLSAGALRVYDGQRACRLNDWSCRSVRRVMIDLDSAGLEVPDVLLGLRQDLNFRDDELAGVVRAMAREIEEGCPHGVLFAESLSMSVLLRLAQTHGRARQERGTLTAAQLRRVDELIAERAPGSPSLTEMAGAVGFSKAHFVRLFRHTTGTSPHRYVMLRRLEHARHLIASSPMSLAAIATEVGFASQSHLTTAFARVYGCTPGVARRDARH